MRSMISPLALMLALTAGHAAAGFVGQSILGNLSAGSVVNGDVTGHADDNDGFTSGMHIFNIWDGGDDVWTITWAGGDMQVDLTYSTALCDVDLFVYRPTNLDDSGDYAIANTGVDTVTILAADAGTYYVNVDSTFFSEGAYTLSVTLIPEPGAVSLFALSALIATRRRRS
ncbi:MAG: PPC domain-containing protein [Phycisphaerales bacterium]